jgi:hypothetical protein
MPIMCFSCPDDIPPGAADPEAVQPSLRNPRTMPLTICFSYPGDERDGNGSRSAGQPAPPGLRRMPHTCFSY